MIPKIKYFLLFILLAGFITSEAYVYVDRIILSSYCDGAINIDMYHAPDQEKAVEEAPVFIFHNIVTKDEHLYHSYLSYSLKDHKQLLNSRLLSHQKVIADIFIRPPGYYIYTLEKIII